MEVFLGNSRRKGRAVDGVRQPRRRRARGTGRWRSTGDPAHAAHAWDSGSNHRCGSRCAKSEADPAGELLVLRPLGLEGIISKRLDKPYVSGRCTSWVKVKNPAYERR